MITNKGCKRLRDLEKKIDSGSVGGNEVFRVTMVDNETDKTWLEIKTAFDAGKLVIVDNNGKNNTRNFISSLLNDEGSSPSRQFKAFILLDEEHYYAASMQDEYMRFI